MVENNLTSARCIRVLRVKLMQQGQKIYQAFVDAGLMQMTSSEIEALIINLWDCTDQLDQLPLYVGSFQ